MSKRNVPNGDTTECKNAAMTTTSAVDNKKVVSSKPKKLDLNKLPVCDPGAENREDLFVDNIFDTDDYEDL